MGSLVGGAVLVGEPLGDAGGTRCPSGAGPSEQLLAYPPQVAFGGLHRSLGLGHLLEVVDDDGPVGGKLPADEALVGQGRIAQTSVGLIEAGAILGAQLNLGANRFRRHVPSLRASAEAGYGQPAQAPGVEPSPRSSAGSRVLCRWSAVKHSGSQGEREPATHPYAAEPARPDREGSLASDGGKPSAGAGQHDTDALGSLTGGAC